MGARAALIYLLDSNIVTKFQRAEQLPALCRAAEHVQIHLVEEVYDELTYVLKAKKRAAAAHIHEHGPIVVDEILPASPESALLARMRAGRTSPRDLGEAASIALAYHCPQVVFVCGDKNGVLGALNELHGSGERVLRPHVFLRRLGDLRLLTAPEILACAAPFREFDILPSWWEGWLASL